MNCPECHCYLRPHTAVCSQCGAVLAGEHIDVLQNFHMGEWGPSVHLDKGQLTKINRAASADCTPFSVDEENQTARFPKDQEKFYDTSLTECSCRDFSIPKLDTVPCKHMYRLAMELHKLNIPFETGVNHNLKPKPEPRITVPKEDESLTVVFYASLSNKKFGCCSRFRECSEAGMCVIPDRDYSFSCEYRKKLYSGEILYGKNRKGFDAAGYDSFCSAVNSLSDNAHKLFIEIISCMYPFNFCVHTFKHSQFSIDCSVYFPEIESKNFFTVYDPVESVIDSMSYSELKQVFKEQFPSPESRSSVGVKSMTVQKAELQKIIKNHCQNYCDSIRSTHIRLSDTKESFLFLVEYYHDYIESK